MEKIFYINGIIQIEEKGRVIESLKKDNYLLFFRDTCFSLFNSEKCLSLINIKKYKIIKNKDSFLVIGKNKILKIKNYEIKEEVLLPFFSKEKIKKEQEKNIQNKITSFLKRKKDINIIAEEYVIPVGRIDILGEKDGVFLIFEIKKGNLKIKDIEQTKRYVNYFKEQEKEVKGYLIGLDYTEKEEKEAKKQGIILKKIKNSI